MIGRHKGLWFHTMGQRKGLGGILDEKLNCKGPWYVVGKDVKNNVLLISSDERGQAPSLSHVFWVHGLNWIVTGGEGDGAGDGGAPFAVGEEERIWVKVRHAPETANATIKVVLGGRAQITLDQKDGGLAPGQYVALYNEKGACYGSGIISEKKEEGGGL